jgi:hypothetical protein
VCQASSSSKCFAEETEENDEEQSTFMMSFSACASVPDLVKAKGSLVSSHVALGSASVRAARCSLTASSIRSCGCLQQK